MKNPLTRSAFAGMAMLAVSALQTNAALIAYENFDYAGGVSLSSGTSNGGTGWSGAWSIGVTAVSGLTTSGSSQSLWFGQSPALITDGSTHVFADSNRANKRDLGTTVNLGSTTLYFSMLFHVFAGANVVDMRAEFFDGVGATGNMRANVGISDGDLFASAATTGYKPTPGTNSTVATGLVAADTTYLLAMKRVGGNVAGVSGIYASLIPGNGDLSTLDSEPVWQVFHAGATGVTFQSFRLLANGTDGGIRLDELRIATDWDSAVTGLIPEPGSLTLLGLAGVSLLLRRRR